MIIIDEIQNIIDIEEATQILKSIINTLDFRERGYISFLLLGYSHGVELLFKSDPSARRSFNLVKLEVMADDEALEVLTKGFADIKLKYDEKLLREKIGVAGGYPYALQVLGQNLVNVDKDNIIDADDWESAIKRSAIELQDKDFFGFYSFSGRQTIKDQIMNIVALANGQFIITRKALSEILGRSSYRHINNLIEQGGLREKPANGQLEPHSKLLAVAISFYLTSQLPDEFKKTKGHLISIGNQAVASGALADDLAHPDTVS